MNSAWGGVVIAVLLFLNAMKVIITGEDDQYWDFPVPAWTGWIEAPVALYILFISCRAIMRGEGKPQKTEVSDQDIAAAKAALDRMYLKDYGALPDYPQSGHDERGHNPDKSPPPDKP